MNNSNKNGITILLLLLCCLCMTGCAQALATASDTFDSLMEELIATGDEPYDDNGMVQIRILTATPTPTITPTPTATPSPTPSPTPYGRRPEGESVDEWVFATEAVNIRSGWTTKSPIVGGLIANDGIHRVEILDNGWSRVSYNGEYCYISSDYLTTDRPFSVGTMHMDTGAYTLNAMLDDQDVVILGVKNILQKPDLPAGPEVTCLAIVLQYLGDPVDKVYLAENYLTLAEPGTATPFEAYLGDPKVAKGSYGCYAPVIVDAANRYFADRGNTNKYAVDISGSTKDQLFDYVKNGMPVIIWGTTNMVATKITKEWEINGELLQWRGNEHCMVLMGYNKTNDTVIVADPLRGIVEFDGEVFFKRYKEQYESAVLITGL